MVPAPRTSGGGSTHAWKVAASPPRSLAPGPHYRTADAAVFPSPVQEPRPPILVVAAGERLLSLAAREADIVALAGSPDESQTDVEEKIGWLRRAAGERFGQLELNLIAAAQEKELPRWLPARLGFGVAELVRSGSLFVLMGTPDQMCEQLLECRETLRVSYVTVPDYLIQAFAPVVERLVGH